MDMQDKDFDKLFSSKLEDFEAEPSARVWEDIADELEDKKAVRPWGAYLSMAAGIAVVFTAGWLLLQKDTQSAIKHHNYANLAHKDIAKPATYTTSDPIVKLPKPAVIKKSSENSTPANRVVSNNSRPHNTLSPINKVTTPVIDKADDAVRETQPAINSNPQLIAKASPATNTSIKPVMPDVQLSPKAVDAVAATQVEKPVVIVSTETEEPVKKRGIHNLGGLINALVSKVDKRPNKFIEFSDGDDDEAETSVTGVNMGPIKFKKP